MTKIVFKKKLNEAIPSSFLKLSVKNREVGFFYLNRQKSVKRDESAICQWSNGSPSNSEIQK